ncbi:TPA: hypothetical protein ACIZAI_001909 [Legionella pneumophila]
MDEEIFLNTIYHRTRKRIRDLGEVFTPEQYAEDMLNLLGTVNSSIWFDLDTEFFEPCCGHGNIVLPILKRRVTSIFKNASGPKRSALYAVANSINTLWAIDIDIQNINECRSRVWSYCINYILEHSSSNSLYFLIEENTDYFIHLLCAIKWHIFENELLSALSSTNAAKGNAAKTKYGAAWFKINGHRPIDFKQTWCDFYRASHKNNLTPLDYEKAEVFLQNLLLNKQLPKGFEFATDFLGINKRKIELEERWQ